MNVRNLIFRKLFSIGYRIILVISASVIIYNYDNYFNNYTYIIATFVYLFIYFFSFFKEESMFRLLNDFLFSALVLFDKSPKDIIVFIFLILPFINASNHSGNNNKSITLAILHTGLFVLMINTNQGNFSLEIFSFVSILIIFFFTVIRHKKEIESKLLHDLLDQYTVEFSGSKTHKVYQPILEAINNFNSLLFPVAEFDNLLCFCVTDNYLWLVNSSNYVLEYNFSDINTVKKIILNNEINYSNKIEINIDGIDYNQSMLIPTHSNRNYGFLLAAKKSTLVSPLLFVDFFLTKLLLPVMTRIGKYIDAELKMRKMTKNHLEQIRNKAAFVSNTERAMHFIGNKLGPISALVESMELVYNDNNSYNVFEDKSLDDLLKKNVKISVNALQAIRNRTKVILNKENNPFNVVVLKTHSSYSFVMFTLRYLQETFGENINIQFDIGNLNTFQHKSVCYNEEGLYFVLTDWTANMLKHGSDYAFFIKESANDYIIIFENNFSEENLTHVIKAINDFNSSDRIEIIRRKSHGIYQMKMTLEEMKIWSKMKLLRPNCIQFTIKIKKHEAI